MPRSRRVALRRRAIADPIAEALHGLTGAERVRVFFRRFLKHSKGQFAGLPFELADWQFDEIIQPLYGTFQADGRRQYRQGYLSFARKAGKSTIVSGLALYHLVADGEMGAEVYAAAAARDQAALVFSEAAAMVEQSPELRARLTVSRATKRIIDRQTRSVFRALSADAPTAHGLNASFVVIDEIAMQPNRGLYDVLATSMGARHQPLFLSIGTAGSDRNSIAYELYEHSKQVLKTPSLDPAFFACIKEVPESADWADESFWHLSNPGLGDFRGIDDLRQERDRALLTPARVVAFKNLYCNQWTASDETAWLSMDAWDRCGDMLTDEELGKVECFGGLDLSSTLDLTAFALAFPVRDRVYVRVWSWLPADGIAERERESRVPYRQWAQEGRLELIPGPVVDKTVVVKRILELAKRFRIRAVGYDRWGSDMVVTALEQGGQTVHEWGQGFISMSTPAKEVETLVAAGKLGHGGCPLLRWTAASTSVKSDPAGNIKLVKPDRLKSTKKIDPMVAIVMGVGVMGRLVPKGNLDEMMEDLLVL
jgi:phage terminase large subunit-like protein